MQLNKKLIPLALAITTSTSPIILNASSSDEIAFKQMKYSESDDRIEIDYTLLDFKKDFGTDYTLSTSISYDSISGGTPVWDSISGASSKKTSDVVSGASACIDESGNYICKDTRSDEIIGDGKLDMSDFKYRNVQIKDTRKAISTSLTKRTTRRDEINVGFSYSKEEDFKSLEGSLSYLYNIDRSRNSSITIGASFQSNSAFHYLDKKWKDFDIVNTQIGFSHIFTKYTVAQINYFNIRQSGVLSNPYQTIIRKMNVSNSSTPIYKYYRAKEKRPNKKHQEGITLNLVSKLHKKIAWHGDYRFYKDDWGVKSHTFTTNLYYNFAPSWTLMPLIRYYTQSEASFYKDHKAKDFTFNSSDYGSADERLAKYNGTTYSLGLEKKINKKLSCNAHYAQQKQSFGLEMRWVSFGLNYSF